LIAQIKNAFSMQYIFFLNCRRPLIPIWYPATGPLSTIASGKPVVKIMEGTHGTYIIVSNVQFSKDKANIGTFDTERFYLDLGEFKNLVPNVKDCGLCVQWLLKDTERYAMIIFAGEQN
jgi:hypothetical protein